ncbi:hypothetical protein [Ammoniphilus sp. CFH 90114]|uniref:hypothetical protein n=1 Tax=Ammoniphilus sp. CFH 90114 TaxID=2493665 RepID=UPI00100F3F64|nr:hypothetical protein [Ammoniphilus sp. CFH 90114]RXT08854.1 hypothetical protein EIZ39_08620 [Ammoniphilus sp. CFH 90114]
MHLLIAMLQGKLGRLKYFVQSKKADFTMLLDLDTDQQAKLLRELIQQVVPECCHVVGKEVVEGRLQAAFHLKGGHQYTAEVWLDSPLKSMARTLVDEVVVPYVLDLWEQMERRRNQTEGGRISA